MKKLSLIILSLCAFAVAADAPKLTDTQKLSIRNAQIEVQQLQLQIDGLQQQYNQLDKQKQLASQKLSEAIKAALSANKLSEEEYTLDGNLELVAKPKPPKVDTVPPKAVK